jgi:hypothetical protein
MNTKDRHNLADAYMSAWHAVDGTRRAVVNPAPNGWYELILTMGAHQITRRVRTSELLADLADLTTKFNKVTK